MAKYLDGTGLEQLWNKIGSTFLLQTGGAVSSSASQVFGLNSTTTSSYITFKTGGVDKAEVGYNSSSGTYLKNYSSSKVLNITDSGSLEFDGHIVLTEVNIPTAAIDLANMWTVTSNASSDATTALTLANTHETVINNINDESVLDLSEKDLLKTKWVTINGIDSLDSKSSSGSYYLIKSQTEKHSSVFGREVYVFYNMKYTYSGNLYTYRKSGTDELELAYDELRSFFLTSEINDRSNVKKNFDRAKLSQLLKNYNDAEIKARSKINEAILENIPTKVSELTNDAGYLTSYQSLSSNEIDTIIV